MSTTLYYAPRLPIHRVHVFHVPELGSYSVVIVGQGEDRPILGSIHMQEWNLLQVMLLSLADKRKPLLAVEDGNILFQSAADNLGPYDTLISDFGQVTNMHDLRLSQTAVK